MNGLFSLIIRLFFGYPLICGLLILGLISVGVVFFNQSSPLKLKNRRATFLFFSIFLGLVLVIVVVGAVWAGAMSAFYRAAG